MNLVLFYTQHITILLFLITKKNLIYNFNCFSNSNFIVKNLFFSYFKYYRLGFISSFKTKNVSKTSTLKLSIHFIWKINLA